jgi:hypothetical protein
MLRANVYQDSAPSDAQLAALAGCLAEQHRALAKQEGQALRAGTIGWVEPVAS